MATDGELVRDIVAGDKQRFAMLVERYQRDVYNLAYRSVNDPQEAEDMSQETFLRAYRALDRWHPERSFRTWLYAIAGNVCRDRARRVDRRPRTVPLLESDVRGASDMIGVSGGGFARMRPGSAAGVPAKARPNLKGGSASSGPLDGVSDADFRATTRSAREPTDGSVADVVVRRERDEAVQRAVAALEPDYRLPLILFYMRGVPQKEIAEIMGVPISVVKNRLYRARRRLRECLRGLVDEAEFDGERGWGG